MTIIQFKSTPENWEKEFDGRKRNTVRVFDCEDIRKNILDKYLSEINKTNRTLYFNMFQIEILNTKTKQTFTRDITDVTYFPQGNCYIISW